MWEFLYILQPSVNRSKTLFSPMCRLSIEAGSGILPWYEKAMNDPYGSNFHFHSFCRDNGSVAQRRKRSGDRLPPPGWKHILRAWRPIPKTRKNIEYKVERWDCAVFNLLYEVHFEATSAILEYQTQHCTWIHRVYWMPVWRCQYALLVFHQWYYFG